jgi:hypothetical protein
MDMTIVRRGQPQVMLQRFVRPLALVRMHCHHPAKDYVARRTAEGKTKTEILRCLKRYIAREVYPLLIGYRAAIVVPRTTTSEIHRYKANASRYSLAGPYREGR